MNRNCKISPDNFCYICGKFTVRKQKQAIKDAICAAYLAYFKCLLGDQDKPLAPHIVCTTCYRTLIKWFNGEDRHMSFGVPMVWREQTNHHDNCAKYDSQQWRLFEDASKSSLKAVLLIKGNLFPPLPVAYSTNTKESYFRPY